MITLLDELLFFLLSGVDVTLQCLDPMLELDHVLAALLHAFFLVEHHGAVELALLDYGLVLERVNSKALVLHIMLESAIMHVHRLVQWPKRMVLI